MKKELKLDLSGAIKRLEIYTNQLINSSFIGNYKSVFRGKGLEFEDYRPYSKDYDDASAIDWKASIRSQQLLIREYVEERNINIFFYPYL